MRDENLREGNRRGSENENPRRGGSMPDSGKDITDEKGSSDNEEKQGIDCSEIPPLDSVDRQQELKRDR